jgi:hypothetical protein
MIKRVVMLVAPLAVVAGGVTAGFAATATAAPAMGGKIDIFVSPNLASNSGGGTIVVIGAVTDHGTTSGNGKGVARLTKGTITINLSAVNKAGNDAKPSLENMTTCSFAATFSAPAPIVSGTGAYTGAKGVLTITETFGGYVPAPAGGKCNPNASPPVTDEAGYVTGTGTISFG